MSNQDFSKFERLNAQIDIWIDEEEYDNVGSLFSFTLSPIYKEFLNRLFNNTDGETGTKTCTKDENSAWGYLCPEDEHIKGPAERQLPFTHVRLTCNADKHELTPDWSHLFWAKLVRAKIQQKGTDCYLRRLENVMAYLEKHLPRFDPGDSQTLKPYIFYLLELAACGIGPDARSFAERVKRIFLYKTPVEDEFKNFYDLLVRYNMGLGHFHDGRFQEAVREFNFIIFDVEKKNKSNKKFLDFYIYRHGDKLLYQPAIMFRAEVQLKLQLAYHALETLHICNDLRNDPSKNYKVAKANLIRVQANQFMRSANSSKDFFNQVLQFLGIAAQIDIDDQSISVWKKALDALNVKDHDKIKYQNIILQLLGLITAELILMFRQLLEDKEDKKNKNKNDLAEELSGIPEIWKNVWASTGCWQNTTTVSDGDILNRLLNT